MTKNKKNDKVKTREKKERLKPISLYPLEVEEALENILKIKPVQKKKKQIKQQ